VTFIYVDFFLSVLFELMNFLNSSTCEKGQDPWAKVNCLRIKNK